MNLNNKTNILLGLFVAAIVAANLLGNKITTILGVSVGVGILSYPILFLITDIIEEVHGKEKAKNFVYTGVIAIVFVFILTIISLWLPPASRFTWNQEYTTVFGISLRIMVASLAAFFISQIHDLWAFNFWKKKTKGRYLWLRNNASTIISQFIDTIIFMFIAFYQVTPKFDVFFIFTLIIPYYMLKILVALCDTPLCYLGVKWLKSSRSSNFNNK